MKKLGKLSFLILIWLQGVGLLIVAAATVVAMGIEVNSMIKLRNVSLPDLLLMFIYLEVLAMVAIYIKSGKLPVRIPLYIAIIALARYLIINMKELDNWRLLIVTLATLLIAATVLIIRYGHTKYPYDKEEEHV